MPLEYERIEYCFHCNKKYIATEVSHELTCPECKADGHNYLLVDRCEICINRIKGQDDGK